jgi:hypothetical protein
MGDILLIGILVSGIPLVGVILLTWLLQHFVALSAPPTQRAAWTVGTAYVGVAALCAFAVSEEYWWASPFLPIPGTLLVFWWVRRDWRQLWIDDSQGIPEGVELANDDWRIGLIFVAGLITLALLRTLFRLVTSGKL